MMARRPRSASPEKNRGTDHEGIARLKRSAPRTKSYWSSPDAFAPRGRCIRLLTKAPARSPRSAPKARTAEAPRASGTVDPKDQLDEGARTRNGAERRSPRTAAPAVPATSPRQVVPSPNRRSPSRKVRPRSIGRPRPKRTAAGFATKAGRKNHRAWGIDSRGTGPSKGRARDIGNPTREPWDPDGNSYLCLGVGRPWPPKSIMRSARGARSARRGLPAPAGDRRATFARRPVGTRHPAPGRRSIPAAHFDPPLARSARSTGTRSRRSDAPAGHSRRAWESPRSYLCSEVGLRPDEPSGGVRESVPGPPISLLIISAAFLYSASRLVRGDLHGPTQDLRRRLRRGPRRWDPARVHRPRRRHAGHDEDRPHLFHPLRERQGGIEGPVHLPRGEPGGPPRVDVGARHDGPRGNGAVHPRHRKDPPRAPRRGAVEELVGRPPEVHRPARPGERLRPGRHRQPGGLVQPEPLRASPPRPVPFLRFPEVPRGDGVPDLGGLRRGWRPALVLRGRVPHRWHPRAATLREGRDGRPAADAVREDAPRAARARLLRPDPEQREVPDYPRDLGMSQRDVFWRSFRSASAYLPASFSFPKVLVAAAVYSSIASTVFVRTETTSLPGARRNRAAMEASAPVITTRRPTGRCITKVDLALRSDSFWIIAVTDGSSRYAVSPAFARTSFPFREITRAIAFDSLWPDASSDQNAASRDSARRRRRRATIASRSRVRARSLSVASISFASRGRRRWRNVWNSWPSASNSDEARPRGAEGIGSSDIGSFGDRALISCSISSTASAKLLSGWRSIAARTASPCPSSSQRSSLRAASSCLAIPSQASSTSRGYKNHSVLVSSAGGRPGGRIKNISLDNGVSIAL